VKIRFFKIFNALIKRYKLYNLKKNGANISNKIVCHGNFHAEGLYENIEIRDNVNINEGVIIQASSKIIIKENVHLSFASKLITAGLDLTDNNRKKHISNPIIIEKNVWIGTGATILGGVYFG
jgi:acetyltransferase-like isoleucine patch superfamily enzyme